MTMPRRPSARRRPRQRRRPRSPRRARSWRPSRRKCSRRRSSRHGCCEEAKAAEAAKTAALEEAKEAQGKLTPISVIISRNTQRLYVRQNREPLFETARHDRRSRQPAGHVCLYRAVAYAKTRHRAALERRLHVPERQGARGRRKADGKRARADRHAEAVTADLAGAKLALERVAIPKEAIDRISEVVSSGLVADRFRRADQQGDREGDRLHRRHEQRAARRAQDTPPPRYMDGGRYRQPSYRAPEGWGRPVLFVVVSVSRPRVTAGPRGSPSACRAPATSGRSPAR